MKRKLKISGIVVLFLCILVVSAHLVYLKSMSAKESYPADSFLDSVTDKRAMLITAHDDDASAFSGTVAKLVSKGWKVRHVCLSAGEPGRNELYEKKCTTVKS